MSARFPLFFLFLHVVSEIKFSILKYYTISVIYYIYEHLKEDKIK
uniref:Uncharacterized protein n=1 Tax=Myoviridae sp. ctIty1 TaxID=2827673 RepID=A0A8S5TGV8_9CAUD|nr:MAG TPA: hypothetical protein [Myoviridae sp. ctIty1]